MIISTDVEKKHLQNPVCFHDKNTQHHRRELLYHDKEHLFKNPQLIS